MRKSKNILLIHLRKQFPTLIKAKQTFLQFVIFALVFCCNYTADAQGIFFSKEDVTEELEKRGITEAELHQALIEKGINLKTLDPRTITPDQIQIIEATILELKAQDQNENIAIKTLEPSREDSIVLPTPQLDEDEVTDPEPLPVSIYGQGLFRNNILNVYQESNEINAPENYILGPGDELVVSIWGSSQFDNTYVVEGDGFIRIADGRQRLFLRGMTLSEARSKVRNVLSRIYSFREGEFDMSLSFARTIRISILGEVFEAPGSYALPAFNSAFNALALVNGPSDIGSLRKIQLVKGNGEKFIIDLYKLMQNPSLHHDYFLEENDLILIPLSENVVSIEGAVKKPMKYELVRGEGLKELFGFCGGFTELAYQQKIQIIRFEDGQQRIIDVDWGTYAQTGRNFELLNGDRVVAAELDNAFRNFVEIEGEVFSPGQFERTPGMKVSDLLLKGGLMETSSLDLAFLTRNNDDGTTEIIRLNLGEVIGQPSSNSNLTLRDRDELVVWSQDRFNDEQKVSVDGAVRLPGSFPYDVKQTVTVRDAILQAGGLSRDASNYAVIHRNDPLNPKVKTYRTINNLDEIFNDPSIRTNFVLEAFDSLVIESKNTFLEESQVRIEGAVNRPGEYQYGQNMTIRDLMTLAGGFKLAASTNNIEISRVVIRNNQPTKMIVDKLELDRSFNVINGGDPDYLLEPFDNVAVRYVNEFELQKRVFLSGEVKYPGPYAISKNNERINSIVSRAGGLTLEAFPEGATLERTDAITDQ